MAEKKARVFVKGERLRADRLGRAVLGAAPTERADARARAEERRPRSWRAGDVVYVVHGRQMRRPQLAQVPEAQSALVALDPNDGAIISLVGGFDYFAINKFNRVDAGAAPAGLRLQAVPVFGRARERLHAGLGDPRCADRARRSASKTSWRPENSSGGSAARCACAKRCAVAQSRLDPPAARDGHEAGDRLHHRLRLREGAAADNLTLALGTCRRRRWSSRPAFAMFANGGFKVAAVTTSTASRTAAVRSSTPRSRKTVCAECEQPIDDGLGRRARQGDDAERDASCRRRALAPAALPDAKQSPQRVISPQNACLMTDMMRTSITRGTGRRALALGRNDLAARPARPTTSNDTWFNGFTQPRGERVGGLRPEAPLGEARKARSTALPIWVHFMREALRGVPEQPRRCRKASSTLQVTPRHGRLASGENPDAIFEYLPRSTCCRPRRRLCEATTVEPAATLESTRLRRILPQSGADPIF